ncbi:HNH endonuclease family protein [Priestia flexa]
MQRGVRSDRELNEPSHIRIKQAYEYLYGALSNELKDLNDNDKYNRLVEYYNAFKNKFSIMCVETDDMNEAFIIFETLNARGKDLETSDLLKNHLFKTSDNLINDVKNEWLKMQENADGIDLTKYFRTIWNSKYDFTREKDLYKNLKGIVTIPSECLNLTQELVKCIGIYKVLIDPINETYFKDKQIEKHIENLKLLNASTYYPIVISMANSSYEETEIKKVVEAIESFIVRNCVIAGKVSNRYEILFAKIAQKISSKHLSFDKIVQELKNDMLSDEEFKNYFMVCSIKSAPVAKFILRKINDFEQKEIIINPSNMKIHLEHIMPKKLGNWKVHEDIHNKYLHRIGNLTLLADEYNKSIKNKEFSEKKKVYKNSKIEMTKKVVSYNEWTSTRIEERQKDLYYIAKQVWKKFI